MDAPPTPATWISMEAMACVSPAVNNTSVRIARDNADADLLELFSLFR